MIFDSELLFCGLAKNMISLKYSMTKNKIKYFEIFYFYDLLQIQYFIWKIIETWFKGFANLYFFNRNFYDIQTQFKKYFSVIPKSFHLRKKICFDCIVIHLSRNFFLRFFKKCMDPKHDIFCKSAPAELVKTLSRVLSRDFSHENRIRLSDDPKIPHDAIFCNLCIKTRNRGRMPAPDAVQMQPLTHDEKKLFAKLWRRQLATAPLQNKYGVRVSQITEIKGHPITMMQQRKHIIYFLRRRKIYLSLFFYA